MSSFPASLGDPNSTSQYFISLVLPVLLPCALGVGQCEEGCSGGGAAPACPASRKLRVTCCHRPLLTLVLHTPQTRAASFPRRPGLPSGGVGCVLLPAPQTCTARTASPLAGLDCPVEVVNAAELRQVSQFGVPFFGVNLCVQLSVSIPGFSADVAKGIGSRISAWPDADCVLPSGPMPAPPERPLVVAWGRCAQARATAAARCGAGSSVGAAAERAQRSSAAAAASCGPPYAAATHRHTSSKHWGWHLPP